MLENAGHASWSKAKGGGEFFFRFHSISFTFVRFSFHFGGGVGGSGGRIPRGGAKIGPEEMGDGRWELGFRCWLERWECSLCVCGYKVNLYI